MTSIAALSPVRIESTTSKIGAGAALTVGLGAGGFALGKLIGARNPLMTAGIGAVVGAAALGALLLGGNSSTPINSQGDHRCPGGPCL
jgi:hypothetical protein